jgi:hypothetical protein
VEAINSSLVTSMLGMVYQTCFNTDRTFSGVCLRSGLVFDDHAVGVSKDEILCRKDIPLCKPSMWLP